MDKESSTSSWSSVTNQLMSTWTEAGTQMWKNWFDLMTVATREPASTNGSSAPSIAQHFFDNQQLLLRLLKLSFQSWQDFWPKGSTSGDWQQFLRNYSDQIRSQFEQFSTGTLKVNQDISELWQLYLGEFQEFNQLWLKAIVSSISPWSKTVQGSSEPWIELNNLYWNLLYQESFGSLMQTPLLGPSREFNGKLLRSFDAWVTLYRASVDQQLVMNDIQIQSFEELMRQLITRAEKGEPVKDWREFQQLWGQVADDVFERAFCSEGNLKVRGRFLNALNTYRLRQQELVELSLKLMNLPSRGEIDEVHKTIYELRKEVKSLQKKLAQYEAKSTAIVPSSETVENASVTPSENSTKPPVKTRRTNLEE